MDRPDREKAAQIVQDAGGRIVGRTRLQKIGFLLELAGLGEGFSFEYKHYGPYSEDLTDAMKMAAAFGLVEVVEHETNWGGWYSEYSIGTLGRTLSEERELLAREAAKIEAVQLELAATAAYLFCIEGYRDPWQETALRKPEKADGGRLERAKLSYAKLLTLPVGNRLPQIC